MWHCPAPVVVGAGLALTPHSRGRPAAGLRRVLPRAGAPFAPRPSDPRRGRLDTNERRVAEPSWPGQAVHVVGTSPHPPSTGLLASWSTAVQGRPPVAGGNPHHVIALGCADSKKHEMHMPFDLRFPRERRMRRDRRLRLSRG